MKRGGKPRPRIFPYCRGGGARFFCCHGKKLQLQSYPEFLLELSLENYLWIFFFPFLCVSFNEKVGNETSNRCFKAWRAVRRWHSLLFFFKFLRLIIHPHPHPLVDVYSDEGTLDRERKNLGSRQTKRRQGQTKKKRTNSSQPASLNPI